MNIPFNKPYMNGNELEYITKAYNFGKLSGDGEFTKKCQEWIEINLNTSKALLTHSCTAALEMASILIDIQPGDEVIFPSYTFVSTANAFVMRGAIPVFVDIKQDTLNIDESKIEEAITEKTKAIVIVHYAGFSCEMDQIVEISSRYNLYLIEDAAQAIMSRYKEKPLGSFGQFATLSFHETKNISCGEGGALLINESRFFDRAEIIREKGTNRNKFFRGEIDKYSWVDIGSSYLPSEINAAFLWAQLEASKSILEERMRLWRRYDNFFETKGLKVFFKTLEDKSYIKHNAHIFYFLARDLSQRQTLLNFLKNKGIGAVFHYIPLHSSEFGKRSSYFELKNLSVTDSISDRIIRLPLWVGMTDDMQDYILNEIFDWVRDNIK